MDKLDNILNDYGFIEIDHTAEKHGDMDPNIVKGLWDNKVHSVNEENYDYGND